MRLTDADKIKEYILTEGFCCDTQADREYVAERIDELFPTVEAIPKEFIEKKIDEYLELGLNSIAKELNVILAEWEKENE